MYILAKNKVTDYMVTGKDVFAVEEFCRLFNKITGTNIGIGENNEKTIRIGGVKPNKDGQDSYMIKADDSGIVRVFDS